MATTAWPDDHLERTIRESLHQQIGMSLRDLDVVAMEGRIRLCGEASSYAHKKLAAELAAGTAGVRQVINQLRVTPS